MKKLVSVILALILCISAAGACLADEAFTLADEGFTLRNGIKFGDTMEDILSKETSLTRKSDDSDEFTGKIAGYNDSICKFNFDDDAKLKSMLYDFSSSCTSKDTTNDLYKKLYQSLVRQYGKPEGNTGGSCELILGPAIKNMGLWVYFMGELDGCSSDYYDYDEWILDVDDYHVKIDLVSYYYRNSDYDYSYYAELSYYMYTDEELAEKVNEKQAERTEVDNDL